MKLRLKSFGMKLWLCFALFSAIIFVALWLLQTVFLQSFYNGMAIQNVQKVAAQIAEQRDSEDLESAIDNFALNDSLLIFLTDWQGNVIYSADQNSFVYQENRTWHTSENGNDNPYRNPDEMLNWQVGAFHNLPQGYDEFLQQLLASDDDHVGYTLENDTAYIYGMKLSASGAAAGLLGGKEAVLYISMPLGAVGAAVAILRLQLVWVTLVSLVIGFVIAYFLSRRFARPVSSISAQAKRMANGNFDGDFEKGFCLELDELSDTLGQTADALAQAENYRRELLANVSHDLRTPLTMIRGYAESVRDITWEDHEKRETDLTIIIREADRLTGLVNDILDYSALQAADQSVEWENVDISSAAQNVMKQFEPLCMRDSYTIEAFIEPERWVRGNKKQLVRVLYNLIDNAIQHAGSSRKIQIVVKDLGKSIRIEVRDYGKGIRQDELPYVWDRYFTSKQRQRSGGGSGLGLAIAKEILLAHKAEFGVENESRQGCLFWFALGKM